MITQDAAIEIRLIAPPSTVFANANLQTHVTLVGALAPGSAICVGEWFGNVIGHDHARGRTLVLWEYDDALSAASLMPQRPCEIATITPVLVPIAAARRGIRS